jgi:PAS domain S-box-containing protein
LARSHDVPPPRVDDAGSQSRRDDSPVTGDSSQLLRIASRLARFGGWSINLAEGRVYWSDEVAAIHAMPAGYSPQLQEGINFFAPEWRETISQAFDACARHGQPYDLELQIVSARGHRVWVRSVGDPVRDSAGRITGVQGAFQDISERKRVEAELAESEVRYRTLFERMTAGFVLLEVVEDGYGQPVDLVILAGNKEFEAATGLRMADVAGARLTQALPGIENDAADWIGRYGRVGLAGEAARFEQRSDLLGADFLVSAFQSGAKRCAVTFVDISERKQAERDVRRLHAELQQHAAMLERRVEERTAELEVARARAEAADQAKSSFLATMSHELRTPLNSIIGFTDILLEGLTGPLNDEQRHQLGIVQHSSRHLLSLITDVLDLARIEAKQLKLQLKRFDLRATVERVAQVFGAEAARKDLRFDLHSGGLEAFVYADERLVEQILHNLLANALKFTSRGTVAISLASGATFVAVAVSDTGFGIKPGDLEKLFQRFSQLENGQPTSRQGTGLGLAISRHLVEAMGGEIRVESQVGRGSRFEFTLPKHPRPTP